MKDVFNRVVNDSIPGDVLVVPLLEVEIATNDGIGSMNPLQTGYGFKRTMPECEFAPPNDYVSFKCWFIDGDPNETPYFPGDSFTVYDNAVVYPHWGSPVVINSYPEDATVPIYETAAFSVSAEGEGLTYRWQLSKDGGENWANCTSRVEGYKTDTISVSAEPARIGWMYRCQITDSDGFSHVTPGAKLTATPWIGEQSYDYEAELGEYAEFYVEAAGIRPKFRWQLSKDGGETWAYCTSRVEGYNTHSISVEATEARNGWMYRCEMTDSGTTIMSDPMTLTIIFSVTQQPESVTVPKGETVTFKVGASGLKLKYHWELSKDGGQTFARCTSRVSGYKTDTITVTADTVRNGFVYRCAVTDGSGNTIYSDGASLNIE